MKTVVKKKLGKQTKLIIIMSSLLVLILALSFVIGAIGKNKGDDKIDGKDEIPDLVEGEATYLNKTVAYPRLEEKDIVAIIVKSKDSTYDLTRFPDENGAFWLSYQTGDDPVYKPIPYIPPISGEDPAFAYESLYAKEHGDGYGKFYMLSYLCSAVGTPYFSERIEFPTGSDEESTKKREALFKEFGFDKEHIHEIVFSNKDKDGDGKEETRHIKVGGRSLSGSGYYFTVDDRPYIYYTPHNYFDYALKGFYSFIRGMLVAEGLPEDSAYEPYLTTDFKEWVNTQHKLDGEKVPDGANIIAKGNILETVNKGADYVPPATPAREGYEVDYNADLNFDLEVLKKHPDFNRIKNTLVGKKVGELTNDEKILLTLLNEVHTSKSKELVFGDKESLTYTYSIGIIESLIFDDGEVDTQGTPVGDCNLVKVSYKYSIDGKVATNLVRHAVVDLTSDGIPQEVKDKIKNAKIGNLDEPIKFDVVYTKDTGILSVEKLYVTDILGIFNSKGEPVDLIGNDSVVSLRFYENIDGVRTESRRLTVSMSKKYDDKKVERIKEKILGKSKQKDKSILVYEDQHRYEYLRDFTTYEIKDIEYFITSELLVSFKFQNASERDPYYGESFFENTLTNAYQLYGLNADACEKVVGFLGGLGDNTNHSQGLEGTTVALGLTHKNMEKYGLYAYRIYFELPRGLYDVSEENESDSEDVLSDFGWHSTLGFNLYISKKDPATGKRYIGSDMYDLIAEVDGEKFDFLEKSFSEFWARKNLVLMQSSKINSMKIDFNMEDIYGKYNFDISVEKRYVGMKNGEWVASTTFFEGSTAVDKFFVNASSESGSMETELSKYMEKVGKDKVSISKLYDEILGNGEQLFVPGTIHTVGVSNFMEAYEMLQLIRYEGVVTEEEKVKAKESEYLMKMTIGVNGKNKKDYYSYEFYRYDDRHVMVNLYKSDENGNQKNTEVCDFYISTFAFKKIVANYMGVINAKELDNEIPFPDVK